MSAAPSESSAIAAIFQAHADLWDAMRGLYSAYQVNTGEDLDFTIPPWKDLPSALQRRFVLLAFDGLPALIHALLQITEEAKP